MTDISKKNFLVDTNLLVYLLDEESEFYSQVFRFFEWAEENGSTLVIAHQNVLELINTLVIDYKTVLREAVVKAKTLLDGKEFRMIFPLPSTLERFFSFSKKSKWRTFDLYLAATAIDNGVNNVVTNNKKDFSEIKEFEAFDLKDVKRFIEKGGVEST